MKKSASIAALSVSGLNNTFPPAKRNTPSPEEVG
uniref:Uncharacterized protein n=1 Tax=Roseihalotalea indica TaxID=2867963 RepID=A0AA49GLF2_9BACT|nr:hypothetical protein K4G66_29325 [Tunicatimonas sp. TK19036]